MGGYAVVVAGILTIFAGDYEVSFAADDSWTIQTAEYHGTALLEDTGSMGVVIYDTSEPAGYMWVGGAHDTGDYGEEGVERIRIFIDGRWYPVANGLDVRGTVFMLEKRSTLGPYYHTAQTVVTPFGITADHELFVHESAADVTKVYAHMLCFPDASDSYIAYEDSTETSGTLDDGNDSVYSGDVEWLLLYNPTDDLAIVYAHSAETGWLHDRTGTNGPKAYMQPAVPSVIGEPYTYTVEVRAFEAVAARWESVARWMLGQ